MINLGGTDDSCAAVNLATSTAADGSYAFANLRPGSYTLTEPVQPAGTVNGITSPGCLGDTATPARSAPPAGSPTDVRYTPVNGAAPPLCPRTPGQDDEPGAVLAGAVNFAANAAIARLVVEVDRDAVPADGQSPVKLKVLVLGADGQPLRQTVFLTLQHSGGRILLPVARTDEWGPRALDADRATPGIQLKVDGGMAEFTLLAPDQAQDVRIRVSAGSQQAAGVVSFVPELRPMVAAGLVEGVVNFRGGGLQPVRRVFSLAQLQTLASRIKADGLVVRKVQMSGHADRLDGTGQPDYNQRLSERRLATVQALLARLGLAGLDAAAVSTQALGDGQPVQACTGAFASPAERQACLLLNRRVDVLFTAEPARR